MSVEPAFDPFRRRHEDKQPQVVVRRLVDDLETPVSAYLKLGRGRPYSFLFESVEGGAWRGRYSILTLRPDLVWRAFGERAEIAVGDAVAAGRFTPDDRSTLDSLRAVEAESRLELPDDVPPIDRKSVV